MGIKETAAIYINESKRKGWEWCGSEVTERGVLHQLAVLLGFNSHYFSDVDDVRLPEKQRIEGREKLFHAIRKKKYRTVIAPDLSHFLRSGDEESVLLKFFSKHNIRLITIDIQELGPMGDSMGNAKSYGVWKGKNRMERDDNPLLPPPAWGWN